MCLRGWRPPIPLGPPAFQSPHNSHQKNLHQWLLQSQSTTHTSNLEVKVTFFHPHPHPWMIPVLFRLALETSLLHHHLTKVLSGHREILEARPLRRDAPAWMQRLTH